MSQKKGILFLCIANSARSQMAEGLAKHLLGDAFLIQSAGSSPSSVNPFAKRVLEEKGIDVSHHTSKSVDQIDPHTVDQVVTLCQEEVCPAFLGQAERFHWPFPDPAGHEESDDATLQRFRTTRDQIEAKIRSFFES